MISSSEMMPWLGRLTLVDSDIEECFLPEHLHAQISRKNWTKMVMERFKALDLSDEFELHCEYLQVCIEFVTQYHC